MGTMLHARGVAFDRCFDELNLTQPETVTEIHRAYVDAGARMIITNSFGANRYKLGQHGMASQLRELNAAAVMVARQAGAGWPQSVLVAGDVGPLGVRLAPFGRVKPAQAYAAFYEQMQSLVESGRDRSHIEAPSGLRAGAAVWQ